MSRSAQNPVLPRLIDPRKFAQQGLSLSGEVALVELDRLAAMVLEGSSPVKVELQFLVDEERRRVIRGRAECELEVACQRCLEPVSISLQAEIELAVVWSEEQAQQLPKAFDPLIVGEGQSDLYAVIEDELLLSLPMVSYHSGGCATQTSFGAGDVEATEPDKQNPFQVLEQLKGSPKS